MTTSRNGEDRYGNVWAGVYDDEHASLEPSDAQLDFLGSLAAGRRTLELGIGTGRVALPLARRHVRVEGVDISPGMVAVMRAKPGGDTIPVTITNMAAPAVTGSFGHIYAVFNTLFSLFTQDDQIRCFRSVARLLDPDGTFCIECFVPEPGRYNQGQTVRTLSLTDTSVRIDASTHDPVQQRVRTNVITLTDGDVASVRPIQLRYAWPAELDLMARLAGLRLAHRHANWERAPFTATSTTHISVYERDTP